MDDPLEGDLYPEIDAERVADEEWYAMYVLGIQGLGEALEDGDEELIRARMKILLRRAWIYTSRENYDYELGPNN